MSLRAWILKNFPTWLPSKSQSVHLVVSEWLPHTQGLQANTVNNWSIRGTVSWIPFYKTGDISHKPQQKSPSTLIGCHFFTCPEMTTPGLGKSRFTPEVETPFLREDGYLTRTQVLFTKKGELATHSICWQPDNKILALCNSSSTPAAVGKSISAFLSPLVCLFFL